MTQAQFTRRGFLTGLGGIAAAATALGLLGCGSSTGAGSTTSNSTNSNTSAPVEAKTGAIELATVDLTPGKLIGFKWGGVYHFRGIQYGTAERWQDPQPVTSYEGGVASALAFGPVAPSDRGLDGTGTPNPYEFMTPSNGTADMVANEQCLYLNVWTKSFDGSKPVVVFLHGGGLLDGASTELSYYDGASFVNREDAVFVSVNHRLNVLGYLDVSQFGSQYANSAVAGIDDLKLALHWVQDNIAKFGGDPKNVTIAGQSGGGLKVITLACMSDTADLFDKCFVASGSVVPPEADKAAGVANAKLLLNQLGYTSIDQLLATSYEDLYNASVAAGCDWDTTYWGNGTFETPLIDADGNVNEYAAARTWIIGSTFSEFSCNMNFTGDPDAQLPNLTDDKVREILNKTYGNQTDAYIEAFRSAWPNKPLAGAPFVNAFPPVPHMGSISRAYIISDGGLLDTLAQANVKLFNYVNAYTWPYFGGGTMGHTTDLALWFNNTSTVGYLVAGDEDNAAAVASMEADALAAFMKNGDPSTDALKWEPYTVDAHNCMKLDVNSEQDTDFDKDLYDIIVTASEAASAAADAAASAVASGGNN